MINSIILLYLVFFIIQAQVRMTFTPPQTARLTAMIEAFNRYSSGIDRSDATRGTYCFKTLGELHEHLNCWSPCGFDIHDFSNIDQTRDHKFTPNQWIDFAFPLVGTLEFRARIATYKECNDSNILNAYIVDRNSLTDWGNRGTWFYYYFMKFQFNLSTFEEMNVEYRRVWSQRIIDAFMQQNIRAADIHKLNPAAAPLILSIINVIGALVSPDEPIDLIDNTLPAKSLEPEIERILCD